MVAPRTTWLFRPGVDGIPREGTLSLSPAEGVLRFDADNGTTFLIELNRLRRAKRVRGSPILQVRYRDADGKAPVAFFYFTSPPPLGGNWRGTPWTRDERKGRRKGFTWLEERNAELRSLLEAWVREIRAAAGSTVG